MVTDGVSVVVRMRWFRTWSGYYDGHGRIFERILKIFGTSKSDQVLDYATNKLRRLHRYVSSERCAERLATYAKDESRRSPGNMNFKRLPGIVRLL